MIAGFLEQTRNVLVGVEASIERALEEGWSMVLEGVHLVPGMLPRIDGALVVQCVLAIEDEEEHSTHFMVRDAGLDGLRPHAKYIERLDDIRRVQDHIVWRAKRHKVPVIANNDIRGGDRFGARARPARAPSRYNGSDGRDGRRAERRRGTAEGPQARPLPLRAIRSRHRGRGA